MGCLARGPEKAYAKAARKQEWPWEVFAAAMEHGHPEEEIQKGLDMMDSSMTESKHI
jgi:hypothetical protein